MPPTWLTGIAIVALVSGAASAITIIADILSRHRQHMWITNVVWPVTALWSGPLGYLAYGRWGAPARATR